MEIVIAENKNYVYISIDPKNDKPLSWEEIQEIKDKFCPDLEFIEVYPRKDRIINKANIRHLFHVKKLVEPFRLPRLSDLECETFKIKIYKA